MGQTYRRSGSRAPPRSGREAPACGRASTCESMMSTASAKRCRAPRAPQRPSSHPAARARSTRSARTGEHQRAAVVAEPGARGRPARVDPGLPGAARRARRRAQPRRCRIHHAILTAWKKSASKPSCRPCSPSRRGAFVAEGCATDLDDLVAEALRRFLESHASDLTQAFVKEDVQWGLRGHD